MKEELPQEDLERQDFVDNAIFKLLGDLKVEDGKMTYKLVWDIQAISKVREAVWEVLKDFDIDEYEFYPFINSFHKNVK